MYNSVSFYGAFNNRTGYGIHATKFTEALERLIPVYRNIPGGAVSVTLADSVSIQNINHQLGYPSILYNVWESTEQPAWFMDRLKYFDQLWVPSNWQRECAIAQGIPAEFIKVVPEGVDPEIFKPIGNGFKSGYFNFIHVGQWQPRKSTEEIVLAFLKAFPNDSHVKLYLLTDTLFPSDKYGSTEERLRALGVIDDRIVSIHFNDNQKEYVSLLQACHCFVSCSRSEGWGLPIIEAMACGLPTIVADFGGSTEYAGKGSFALRVSVPNMLKPKGIFGDWDVPGHWGEPSYEVLPKLMQNIRNGYKSYYKNALKDSERIRNDFSWDSAAKKALEVIREIPEAKPFDLETDIHSYAEKHGYEIVSMKKKNKRNAIFVVDCWPSSQDKMDTLAETIQQIHATGYEVLVTSHYPLPPLVTELADYYIFEKRDIMSGDDKPIYWRTKPDGKTEHAQCNNEYQGVAAINCLRNAIDFLRGRYEWIYQMSADMEVDLNLWLSLVENSNKPMVCIPYEGIKNGFGGGLWAGKTDLFDKVIPYLTSWKQYADMYPDVRFVAERWIFNYVSSKINIDENVKWIDILTKNRFDNVDRDVWKDDIFGVNFIDGAFLNISGISNREYDVEFSTPTDGVVYGLKQKVGMWSKPTPKYFKDWQVQAKLDGEVKFEHKFSPKDQRIVIAMGSKALGDTIAWMPYVEEFRKKHNCHVICASWWSDMFDYPEIEFVKPGTRIENIYGMYNVGCFDGQLDRNVKDWRLTPLQKVAADILGLDYEPIRPKLKVTIPSGSWMKPSMNDPLCQTPYICFSEYSTMQNKLWNRDGAWQKVINYMFNRKFYCVSVSVEASKLNNTIKHNGQSIEQTISDIAGCEFYIGLNHGPAWIAYALDKPVIMITGVSEVWNDFPNPYRIAVDSCTPGCFNDPSVPIDRSWNWCPRNKNYVCTRDITPDMVIDMINTLIKDKQDAGRYYANFEKAL